MYDMTVSSSAPGCSHTAGMSRAFACSSSPRVIFGTRVRTTQYAGSGVCAAHLRVRDDAHGSVRGIGEVRQCAHSGYALELVLLLRAIQIQQLISARSTGEVIGTGRTGWTGVTSLSRARYHRRTCARMSSGSFPRGSPDNSPSSRTCPRPSRRQRRRTWAKTGRSS